MQKMLEINFDIGCNDFFFNFLENTVVGVILERFFGVLCIAKC